MMEWVGTLSGAKRAKSGADAWAAEDWTGKVDMDADMVWSIGLANWD